MRPVVASWLALVLLAPTAIEARPRAAGEDLMQVVTPTSRAVANAHPHVNVFVGFGAAKDGTPADPSTFRAKFNGRDLTGDFVPLLTGDAQTGVRATIPARLLKISRGPRNRLRLSIQAARSAGKGPRVRDVDRLRFGAADGPNQPPVATIAAGSESARLGTPVDFDASASHDPDADELTFEWTFSDGGTASGPIVSHAFTAAQGGAVGATVTVSDGVAPTAATMQLPVAIEPDPGRTMGVLRIEADSALEFSAVGVGATATRSLVIHNVDTTATSQLKVQAFTDDPAFSVVPPTLDLGPDASAPLDVTFAPAAGGHASTRLRLLVSASNRSAVTLLAHGFGGAAPGDGPTLLAVPVFGIGIGLTQLSPDGTRVAVDETTGTCAPPTGFASGDVCVVDGDCNAGETCSGAAAMLDVTELCSDGQSLFVLSEESYTDPNPDADPGLTGSVVRFDLDGAGGVTGRRVLYRTTDETLHISCDQLPASTGGLAYLAEFHGVDNGLNCDRDERDALVTINKTTGNARSIMSRIDQAAGVGDCDFRDGVAQLHIAADGVKKYAAFDSAGIWRIAPTPLPFTPDVRDGFQVAPDGSIVFAIAHDRGTTATIDLYRMTEAQVEHGSLPVADLTPCASFGIPNNTTGAAPATSAVTSIVLGPSALAAPDTVALVTFRSRPQTPAVDVLPPSGDVRGTVAFSLAGASTTCAAQGLVSLTSVELAR
jgi:hypothetical protein